MSLEAAVQFAALDGTACELVVAADRTEPETLAWLKSRDFGAYAGMRLLDLDNGSIGPSRNAGIAAATGEFVMTADADDLVSVNMISASIAAARAGGQNEIYFPQWLLAFGLDPHLYEMFPLSTIGAERMVWHHPYISRYFARRSELAQLAYCDLRLSTGFAFEDWHFNLGAIAAGFDLKIVPGATLYYRQRANSLLRQAGRHSVGITAWSRFFAPEVYLPRTAGQTAGPVTPAMTDPPRIMERFLESRVQNELMLMAARIEPGIDPPRVCYRHAFSNAGLDARQGLAWARICEALQGRVFDEVLLTPFLSHGGGEKFILSVIDSLLRHDPSRRLLVLSGQRFAEQARLDLLPDACGFLDLPVLLGFDDPDSIDILAVRALQTFAPQARVHIKASPFAQRFVRRFASVLTQPLFFYRFSDGRRPWRGDLVTDGDIFGFVSEVGEYFRQIICDNDSIRRADTDRLDYLAPRYCTLRNWVADDLDGKAKGPATRILWASRLDFEKRPGLVAAISRRLAEELPDVCIDMWGGSVLGGSEKAAHDTLAEAPNVKMCGPYKGFGSLPLERYGLFLYTTYFDGLPNVVLEAMRAGLVVIAPMVGGIGQVVTAETGYPLADGLSDNQLVEAYLSAIRDAVQNSEGMQRRAVAARRMIEEHHTRDRFDAAVVELFATLDRPIS